MPTNRLQQVKARLEIKDGVTAYLLPEEVAFVLGVTGRALEAMRLRGKAPPHSRIGIGGRAKVLYDIQELKYWIETTNQIPNNTQDAAPTSS